MSTATTPTAQALIPYTLVDRDSGVEHSILARDLEHASEIAVDWAAEGDWDMSDGTVWVDVYIRDEDGEVVKDLRDIQIDPEEPDCSEDEHDWQSPHEIVGGLEENPGVSGHGGGVIITEVCMHCGCARIYDTWAQRPDTGQQGLESVQYKPGQFAAEVAALAEDEEDED